MAILVPAGIIFPWYSTEASIPATYTRETALDGYHVKGAAASANPGDTGGGATHTHASATHTHTLGSHSHTFSQTYVSYSGGAVTSVDTTAGTPDPAAPYHVHSGGTATGSNTSTLSSQSVTSDTGSSEPSYAQVIWIRSLGTGAGIPNTGWAWWDNVSAAPSGWSLNATASGRYLKGAAAGANGGSTGGGGSHSHTYQTHQHSIASHSHSGGSLNTSSGEATNTASGGSTTATAAHTHTYTVTSTTSELADAGGSGVSGSTSLDPVFTTLAVVANGSGGYSFPDGIIGIWLGLLTNIPSGWILCDGTGGTVDTRAKFVKSAASLGGIATTGGSATHTHTAPSSHAHITRHKHPVTVSGHAAALTIKSPGAYIDGALTGTHTHTGGETDLTGSLTSGSGSLTVVAGSSEPLYKTVLFVKFTGAISCTVTSPSDGGTITAPGATVTWALSDTVNAQATRRVRIYATNDPSGEALYDSGTASTSSTSYTLPDDTGLRTGNTYYLRVTVTDTAGDPGDSPLSSFLTDWDPPATITGLTVTPVGGT